MGHRGPRHDHYAEEEGMSGGCMTAIIINSIVSVTLITLLILWMAGVIGGKNAGTAPVKLKNGYKLKYKVGDYVKSEETRLPVLITKVDKDQVDGHHYEGTTTLGEPMKLSDKGIMGKSTKKEFEAQSAKFKL